MPEYVPLDTVTIRCLYQATLLAACFPEGRSTAFFHWWPIKPQRTFPHL